MTFGILKWILTNSRILPPNHHFSSVPPLEMNSIFCLQQRSLITSFAALAFMFTSQHSFSETAPLLASALEPIRVKHHLPALAGAIFTTDGLVEQAAVGVRKAGDATPVTTNDLWHLGSDSKAMTATLAGTFVAEKKLAWDAKVISFFPEIANQVSETTKGITLGQVLTHEAGLKENLDWSPLFLVGTVTEQRATAAHLALVTPRLSSGNFSLFQHRLCRRRSHPRKDRRQTVGGSHSRATFPTTRHDVVRIWGTGDGRADRPALAASIKRRSDAEQRPGDG